MPQLVDAAEGIQPRKRRRNDAEIDITPMIDVVFLLLAFFVIVSKMDPSAAVAMPQSRYGDTIPDANCVVLIVSETEEDAPRVYLGRSKSEHELARGSAADIADEIERYVDRELRQSAEKMFVLIKAERQVKSRHVSLVKDAVSRVINEELGHKIFFGIEEN